MNETLKSIYALHSTHGNFTEDRIPEGVLDTIVDASLQAANSGPLTQNYAIVVVDDKDVMKEVSGYVADKMLVFCVDFSRNLDIAKHLELSYDPNPAWAVVTGITDVILAAQNSVLAAHSLGVDSLISNGVQRGDPKRVWSLLDLPRKHCFPVIAVYLGYADTPAFEKGGRLGEPGVIHRGKYARDESDIAELLKKTDELNSKFAEKWKEAGFQHYLEMYFAGTGVGAATSYTQLGKALEDAGFSLT